MNISMNNTFLIMFLCLSASIYSMENKKTLLDIYKTHPQKVHFFNALQAIKNEINDSKREEFKKTIKKFGCLDELNERKIYFDYLKIQNKKKQQNIVRLYNRFKNFDMQGFAIPDAPSFKKYNKWVKRGQEIAQQEKFTRLLDNAKKSGNYDELEKFLTSGFNDAETLKDCTSWALEDANLSLLTCLFNAKVLDGDVAKKFYEDVTEKLTEIIGYYYLFGSYVVDTVNDSKKECCDAINIFDFFIENKIIDDIDNQALLFIACIFDCASLAKVTLNNGALINWESDEFGDISALLMAYDFKSLGVVRMLLESGACKQDILEYNTGQSESIITYDDSVYQINVPSQGTGPGCGFLAFQNVYHVLDAFQKNQFIGFIQTYKDRENFSIFGTLSRKGGITFNEFRQAEPEEEFKQLKNQVVYVYSSDPRLVLNITGGGLDENETKPYVKIVKDLVGIIQSKENRNDDCEEIAIQAALVKESDYLVLKKHVEGLHKNKNYYFGIVTTSCFFIKGGDLAPHALAFVINKHNDDIRYYFIDSVNVPFNGRNDRKQDHVINKISNAYCTSIERLKAFVEQPVLLDNAIVRYFYYACPDKDEFKNKIESLGLQDNAIYNENYK